MVAESTRGGVYSKVPESQNTGGDEVKAFRKGWRGRVEIKRGV